MSPRPKWTGAAEALLWSLFLYGLFVWAVSLTFGG